jgi:signal transduction histidine kinase
MDPHLTSLLAIYGAILVLNIVISLLQRRQSGDNPATRAQLVLWTTAVVICVVQGLFQRLDAWVLLMAPPVLISNFALARLGEAFLGVRLPEPRRYLPWLAILAAVSLVLFQLDVPFTLAMYPAVIASEAPIAPLIVRGLRKWSGLRFAERGFLVTTAALSLHGLDFPLLRPISSVALFGFALGFSLVIVLSILIPMLINERAAHAYQETLEREVALRTRQLLESARFASVGKMAGGVAHEVNSPLTAIQTYAATLREAAAHGALSPEEVARTSQKILEVVQRIARITGALRLMSRESGVVSREVVPIKPIIDRATAMLSDQLTRNAIDVNVEIDPACPRILVNTPEIVHLLVGLLANAIDALERETKRWIRIVAAPAIDGLAVAVTDAGRLSPDIAERIMDPFFTTKSLGLGLGLSVGRGIAEAHGGRLRLAGDRANTTFVLWLPAAVS